MSSAATRKVYGGSLYRLRLEDFGELQHEEGVSPAWPVGYDVFEPYYTRAERLFQVHGTRGADPTEPWASAPYPHAAVRHEPRIQQLADALTRIGHHPYPQPLAILLDEDENGAKPHSPCIRCDAFDGYPCLTNGKADAQIVAVDPALAHPNVTLLTGRLCRAAGDRPVRAHGHRRPCRPRRRAGGLPRRHRRRRLPARCRSALLMLRSASDAHPHGLANGSGLVGRNYMRHNNSAFMAVSREPNDTVFQKTLALSDFYFGADDYDFPLGEIQMIGKSHGDQVKAEGLPAFLSFFPNRPFDELARHSLDFWVMTEDLPRADNRISYRDGQVVLDMQPTGDKPHKLLRHKLEGLLSQIDAHPHLLPRSLYLGKDVAIGGTAHQAGTMVFGPDPATSVLNLDCRAHEVDNLYCTDAGLLPLDRRGQSDADDHRQCDARGGSSEGAAGLSGCPTGRRSCYRRPRPAGTGGRTPPGWRGENDGAGVTFV